MSLYRILAIVAAGALPLLATAATPEVWRCGNTYSTTPCAKGGRALEALEQRPEADVQAAKDQAEREQRLAAQMRQERLREEAAASRRTAVGIGPQTGLVPVAATVMKVRGKPQRQPKHRLQRSEDADTWRAAGPSTRRAKG